MVVFSADISEISPFFVTLMSFPGHTSACLFILKGMRVKNAFCKKWQHKSDFRKILIKLSVNV